MFLLLGMGGAVGFLSGMFGVGGGFLMTPLLIFIGVPSTVAVATEANQIVASSVSGVIAHTRRKNVDFKMGSMLLIGGVIGAQFGARVGMKMQGEQLRILLALMVLAVCVKLGFDLMVTPDDLFSLGIGGGH